MAAQAQEGNEMKKFITQFCSVIFARHIGYFLGHKISKNPPHKADYEVCRDFWCVVAYWLERKLHLFEAK
jgi:hypothetical protein